jgi:DNA replication protein DnaC
LPSRLSDIAERIRAQQAEHEARLVSDPGYRAEFERGQADLARRRQDQERAELDIARRERRVAASMPPRVWPMLDSPLATEALGAVERFLSSSKTFLVLAGAVGCGKTVAACSAIDRRGGGVFVKAAAVTRARFDDEAWEVLLHARVLVVDDLGTEPLDEKGWAAGALAELFDHRYDWQTLTILTTNLDGDGFKARYCREDGGRFLSRLREAGVFEVVSQGSLRPSSVPQAG